MLSNLNERMITKFPRYVLISPARNEEELITLTIKSVIKQSVLPLRWIIVSNGSTDKTEAIIKDFELRHSFIKLISRESSTERNFASKVNAITEGYENIKDLDFDFVGFVDADMSCEPNFFESVIIKMANNPNQGIGGGVVFEKNTRIWKAVKASYSWSVAGTMQMFRRQCYEQINGYQPLKLGGEDTLAEVRARMLGWEVKTFEDLKLYHHRFMGANEGNRLKANFKRGIVEYIVGYHPLIQILRFFTRIPSSPFFIASFMRTAGYYYALLRHEPHPISEEIIKFLRKEQIGRLLQKLGFSIKKFKKA